MRTEFHWSKPDYFKVGDIFTPAKWFPDHTIMGKVLNVLDPIGSAIERKSISAEKEALAAANKEYDAAIADSQAKVAQATQAQKDAVAQAEAGDKKQNMVLILIAVVVLGIGIVFIIKKKKK